MVKPKIRISKIDTSRRLRPIDPAHAEVIAASIAEVGLKQAIVVRPHPHADEEGCPYEYELVIGAHRLHAVYLVLGWNELEVGAHVTIDSLEDDQALLAEIDENLARHELNALDRAIFLVERKRLYLAMNPEAGRGKAKKTKGQERAQSLRFFSRSFASATSERVGLSKRAIELAVSLAEKLDEETIAALRGTSVETNQKELLALAAITDMDQRHLVVAAIREGKAKSTLKAKIAVGLERERSHDPQASHLAAATYHVSKMDAATRKIFMADNGFVNAPAKASSKGDGK
jgi:ParB family chromosome partitioning protein